MSDYNWCHGTNCHTQETQSRVRGTGDNKVLRTRKVKVYTGRSMYGNGGGTIWDYFCNHSCLMDYLATHSQAVVDIAPRRNPLETPIKVEKTKEESHRYKWTDSGTERVPYMATRTTIKNRS
tara:strand:- start:38 stop:403 length:366 start_codon:yes stop_codon:yes gene_type:complete